MGVITFRLDDITPDMNWKYFYRIEEIFEGFGVKPLIGVVPKNRDTSLGVPPVEIEDDSFITMSPEAAYGSRDEMFWSEIRRLQEKGWCIAQHGYDHRYTTQDSGILGINPFSEFAGLPYKQQCDKIKKGQKILAENGISSTIFMAPGHTFDKNTLKALKENGFLYVTDGYSNQCYVRNGLCFIPCTQSTPRLVSGVDTVCYHTNHMTPSDFLQLENFIRENREKVKDFSQVLKEAIFYPYSGHIKVQEKKQLTIRKMKNVTGTSKVLQEYLQRTNSANRLVKMGKRIVCFPMLIGLMIKNKKNSKRADYVQ